MLVTRKSFQKCVAELCKSGDYAADTETTGRFPYQGDRLFALIVASEDEEFYFNFKTYPGLNEEYVLGDEHRKALRKVFANRESTFAMHNAKFDLAMLAMDGIEVEARVHCTEAIARVEYNEHFTYSLAACAKRIGEEKSKAVDEYIKKHKCYKRVPVDGEFDEDGEQVYENEPDFTLVPLDIMHAYGCTDARITYRLMLHQRQAVKDLASRCAKNARTPLAVLENEMALTKTVFGMERVGVKIDRPYCLRARAHEEGLMAKASGAFESHSGVEFLNSWKVLSEVFDAHGLEYPRTKPTKTRPKGTPSFKDDFLATVEHPIGQCIRDWRESQKKVSTYYKNFLGFSEDDDVIHCNLRQGGTATGRMSCAQPNLQNLNKEEDTALEFLVRRSFVPRDDFCFVMIDYDQMEYRLMLDYAAEMDVIHKIMHEGLDVHAATAAMMGVTRQEAKTINFLLLYGGGVEKLAAALKITVDAAYRLRRRYFAALPHVTRFIRRVIETAEKRGSIFNWAGRVCHFPNPMAAYKAPNYLIQGGCADIVKKAMNDIAPHLQKKKARSRMLLQVHDELLFEVHKQELDIVPELQHIMEKAYTHKHLPLTAGASYSWKSWADKIKGFPEARAA